MKKSRDRLYSSKILKSGALLAETKVLLANWNNSLSVDQNLDRYEQENVLGKASRSRLKDILDIFKQRYLIDDQNILGLNFLAKNRYPAEGFDRILFFHAARADLLMHDFVTERLKDMYEAGIREVRLEDANLWIRKKIDEVKTRGPWSEQTIIKSGQGLLSALRDYGILQGIKNKHFAPMNLPVEAFSYIAFCLNRVQPSGKRLIEDPEWRLFFLNPQDIEHLFMEAHQLHLLSYQAAGSVIRISFPSVTIEEYAHVILERTP
jgi:hypothetical protein